MPPHSTPSTARPLQSIYPTLIRPIIAPDFCQPLLADAVTYLDPLLEDTTVFTAPQRIREIGVEVDGIVRSLRRANAGGEVSGDDSQAILEGKSPSAGTEEVLARARERRKAFDAEMKREEEEALKTFKEGLRKTVASQ
ncbi:hypothetical protein L873DRAFT_1693308 [Choiromyces venosus 120613-1]|uniref:Uncharacterized protein n=1 Tax=Choiromyces venosus 120613-1 TaxID=1336337 RepID=A0A3N4JF18_9PEZI|nr:hypothetical protein L873DRAFT_1693308 [Choiromyces venosus 120613-1]